ncbi:MAG: nuoJ [Gammaproteobacteria bacterium]|jgi:NADH-quinone oxidoreductase subunit J|nr:nuoJ [Gammaproteobacteria bacterium]
MGLILQQTVFYAFSAILLFSAAMVVLSINPVRAVLFLVLAFFCACILWMLLQAEFLALVLIFVYIGAVMTLFLFVIMMLNLDIGPPRKGWLPYLPLAVLVLGLFIIAAVSALKPEYFDPDVYQVVTQPENYSNTKALGAVLYTEYVYPFELAAVLLLVAIISAICLAFRGKRPGGKAQRISEQLVVRRKDRVSLINMPSEKK